MATVNKPRKNSPPGTNTLHRAQGDPRLGLLLALTTVVLWGFLSIALKLLLEGMDPITITWYRLTAAAAFLVFFQLRRGRLPTLRDLDRRGWTLLAIAILGLTGNYVLFVLSLDFVPPVTAQLVVQLAPLLFLLGGLLIFRESFSGLQWLGLVVLILGLLSFFNDRLGELLRMSGSYSLGVLIVVASAMLWAAYALAQKQLLVTFTSVNILLLIYLGASILLLPVAHPAQILALTRLQIALLVFATFNTLAAYGSFAEALEHWEASRVSAVIALTPLMTIAAVYAALMLWPGLDIGRRLNILSLAGAVLVVGGSVMAALGRKQKDVEPLNLE